MGSTDGPHEIRHLADTTSTHDYLARIWKNIPEDTPVLPYIVVLTDFQSAGRGRLGREWVAPRGTSLLMSVLVPAPPAALTWIPLTAGSVTAQILRGLLPDARVELKWPNDVLINDHKVGGVLTEYLGLRDGHAWVALGVGINLTQTREQLPSPSHTLLPSTSVALEGASVHSVTALAAQIVTELRRTLESASLPTLRQIYANHCVSLRSDVKVTLPDGEVVTGRGFDIDPDGALLVKSEDGVVHTVRAGDVAMIGPGTDPSAFSPSDTSNDPPATTPEPTTSGETL